MAFTFYVDYEEGDNRRGGTSFNVLASGSDGATNGARNLHSATATFTPDMVGHLVALRLDVDWWDYDMIQAYVDAHNVTLYSDEGLYDAWGVKSGMQFAVGGRWKSTNAEATQEYASPWNMWAPPDCWAGETRVKATEYPVSLGSATWANGNALVTFADPFCAEIHRLSAVWTAAANNSTVSTTTFETHVDAAQSVLIFNSNQANIALNTKSAYMTLGAALDLSGWGAISFWMSRVYSGTMGDTRICLCSDATGDVIVADFVLPTVPLYGVMFPVLLDFGGPLPASVQSVAIYTGLATKPAASQRLYLNNLIAVKPPGDPKAFSVGHLVGKVNNAYWQASTPFSLNDKRKPTPPNRNGFRYKATTAGTTGVTEPVWPMGVGATVVDGTVTWTCDDLEDTWWPILGVESPTSLTIYHGYYFASASATGRNDVFLESETCETRVRAAFELGVQGTNLPRIISATTVDNHRGVHSGGWNRTDMSVMDGESWFSAVRQSASTAYALDLISGCVSKNFGIVRSTRAVSAPTSDGAAYVQDVHANGNTYGMLLGTSDGPSKMRGISLNGNIYGMGYSLATQIGGIEATVELFIDQLMCDNNSSFGALATSRMNRNWRTRKNPVNIRFPSHPKPPVIEIQNLVGRKAAVAGTSVYIEPKITPMYSGIYLKNPDFDFPCLDVKEYSSWPFYPVIFDNLNGSADMRLVYDGDSSNDIYNTYIQQETGANRHTLTGRAWRVQIGTANIYSQLKSVSQEFKVALQGGAATIVSIWVRRDSAALAMRWVLGAGFASGVVEDIEDFATGTLGAYEQLSITVTPDNSCVGVFKLQMYYDAALGAFTAPLVGYFDDLGVV